MWRQVATVQVCFRILTAIALMFCVLAASAEERADQRRSEMLVTTDWLAAHLQDSDLIVLCIADNDQFYLAGMSGRQADSRVRSGSCARRRSQSVAHCRSAAKNL